MYALITGASSGIGYELAKLYAKDGYDLILIARNKNKLEQLALELKQYSISVLVKAYDLSVASNCYEMFEGIKHLNVNVFINNAGYGNLGYYNEVELDLELNMLDLNIKAVEILTKLYLQNYKIGTVVNVSSMAAFLPTPTFSVYSASKAYVLNMSLAIAYELKKQKSKLRVVTVAPGPVKTDFNERAKANINRGMNKTKCAKIIYADLKKNKGLIIPGFAMKLTRFLIRFIPKKILLSLSYRIQIKK